MTSRTRRGIPRIVAAALAATLGLAGVALAATPASAAPRVSITVADRPGLSGVADSTYLTELTLSGAGFQSIQNGFGGIYVLFGWVSGGGWQPSQGGHVGSNYRYVYDDEANPVGYQLFANFPGSSTGYAANGGQISSDGSWNATIRIPGPLFQSYDRDGTVSSVNCLEVQCGIITIGAHGVTNASNESFTPITFQQIYSAADGRQVIAPSEPVVNAVAPGAAGGRPATIPNPIAEDQLTKDAAKSTTAEAGVTRLTLTLPGSVPGQWYGVYLHSEPMFTGWFTPNSQGKIDVNLPETLEGGEHRAVIVDVNGALQGWAGFERVVAEQEDAPAVVEQPVAAQAEPMPLALIVTLAAVGLAALAAVAVLIVVVIRSRRTAEDTSE